jgi:hypothetical protein
MKLFLILMASALVAGLLLHYVPASHHQATTVGDNPIKWWMIGAVGFAAFAFFASRKK